MNTITHCKITFNGQIRRFALLSTEFTSLKETITRLFSLNGEFVLKYRDDELDYITLDNQIELETAITISPDVLRLLVIEKNNTAVDSTCNGDKSRGCRKRFHDEHKDHHLKDRHHHKDHRSKSDCNFRSQKKLAFINQCLADFGNDDSALSPAALFKKQKLLTKKQRIENYQNDQGYHQRKKLGLLSCEEEYLNTALKSQIMNTNMESRKVKNRLREIKMMLQDKEDQTLLKEMCSLKEQKKLLKNHKRALVDQLQV